MNENERTEQEKRTEVEASDLTRLLGGIREAVNELRGMREFYEKNATVEAKSYVRFAELTVIQMAEALADKPT